MSHLNREKSQLEHLSTLQTCRAPTRSAVDSLFLLLKSFKPHLKIKWSSIFQQRSFRSKPWPRANNVLRFNAINDVPPHLYVSVYNPWEFICGPWKLPVILKRNFCLFSVSLRERWIREIMWYGVIAAQTLSAPRTGILSVNLDPLSGVH